jgi:hypothetical protein
VLFDRAQALMDETAAAAVILAEPGFDAERKRRLHGMFERIVEGYVGVILDWSALFPDDLALQTVTIDALFGMPRVARALNVESESRDQAWRSDALARAEALLTRSPSSALYRKRAQMCSDVKENELKCLRLFAKCLALDSSDALCKGGYAEKAREYTSPRCSGTAIRPGFGLFVATSEDRANTRPLGTAEQTKVRLGGHGSSVEKGHIDRKATFTSNDFESAQARTATLTEQWWDSDAGIMGPTKESNEEQSLIVIRPERQAAFAAWLANAPKEEVSVVLVRDNAVVYSARLPSRSSDRPKTGLQISLGIPEVCARVEQLVLPADLPRP